MKAQKRSDDARVEKSGMPGESCVQGISEQVAKGTSQPFVRRNIETDFLSAQDGLRQFVFHQFPEQEFLARSADFERRRERCGKLDDAVIEEWRPHLDRVGHADAIDLGEYIVGQEILLIEP